MKAPHSFMIFSSGVLSVAADTTVGNVEHTALLQAMSKSEFVVARSHDDALKRLDNLNQHVEQIWNLGKEHKGKVLPKDAKSYLTQIKALAASMLDQLRIDHKQWAETVSKDLAAVNACNTADLNSVTNSLKAAEAAMSTHDSCRVREVAQKKKADGACTSFRGALDTARACSAKAETQALAKYKSSVNVYKAIDDLESQAKACEDSLKDYETENTQCKADQLNAEKKTCEGHLKSNEVCGKFDECHATTRKQYLENACVDMVEPRDCRKNSALAVNTITCLTDKLLSDDTKKHTADSLSECDISKTDQSAVTKEFDITCAKPDDKKVCEWPGNYLVAPGTPDWFEDNYRYKDWFALATNDVASGAPIEEVEHTCDLTSLAPASMPLSSGATPDAGGGEGGETSYTTPTGWKIESNMPTYKNGKLYWLSNAIDGSTTAYGKSCSSRDDKEPSRNQCYWLGQSECTGSTSLSVEMEKERCVSHILLEIGSIHGKVSNFQVFADDDDITPKDLDSKIKEYNSEYVTKYIRQGKPGIWHIYQYDIPAPLRIDVKAKVKKISLQKLVSSGLCGIGEISLVEGAGEC